LLLTDANGIYHNFIKEMLQTVESNSLIFLYLDDEFTKEEVSMMQGEINTVLASFYDKFLCDNDMIETLSKKGSQPTVELLAKNFMAD